MPFECFEFPPPEILIIETGATGPTGPTGPTSGGAARFLGESNQTFNTVAFVTNPGHSVSYTVYADNNSDNALIGFADDWAQVTGVVISGVQLMIPPDFTNMTGLTSVTLENDSLQELPTGFAAAAPSLTSLLLDGNQFITLPFADLSNVVTLNLSNNPLSPVTIAGLTKLVTLGLNTLQGSNVITVRLPNGSFEVPTLAPGTYLANPPPNMNYGEFVGTSGIASNGSVIGNPNAVDGNQVAYISGTSGIVRLRYNFPDDVVSFTIKAAQASGSIQEIQVTVDDTVVGNITPSSSFASYNFGIGAGTHQISFQGLVAGQTAVVDDITISVQAAAITLGNLPSLQSLDISNNNLNALPTLTGCTFLTDLNISGNLIASLPDLSSLTSLVTLNAASCDILTSVTLNNYPMLSALYVGGCELLSRLSISNCPELNLISASEGSISSFTLTNTTALISIDLSNNDLTTLPDLSGLSSLVSLNLSGNELTTISLTGLSSLQTLDVSYNRFVAISFVGLSALNVLSVGHNQFTSIDFTGLANLTSLLANSLQHLTAVDLSPLISLKRVSFQTSLSLSSVTGLTSLTNLVSFVATQCAMTAIDLSGCTELQNIYLDGNKFSVPPDLTGLTQLGAQSGVVAFNNNSLSSAGIDTIINQIATIAQASNTYNGYLGLEGQSPAAPPTVASDSARAVLSSLNWTVTTD